MLHTSKESGIKHYRVVFAGVFLLAVSLLCNAGLATAANIVVNSLADAQANDGFCTLREAIINANNNDQSGSTDNHLQRDWYHHAYFNTAKYLFGFGSYDRRRQRNHDQRQ